MKLDGIGAEIVHLRSAADLAWGLAWTWRRGSGPPYSLKAITDKLKFVGCPK